jgi:hypothetical protein
MYLLETPYFSERVQILNTSGQPKTADYFATVCTDLMKEIAVVCPAVAFACIKMDSAAANRAGMTILDQQRENLGLPPLVNLQCCSHTLLLLLKDMYKRFTWVRDVFDGALLISTAINTNESMRFMFQNVVTESGANATSIATHSESRLG